MSRWTHVIATMYLDDIGAAFLDRPNFDARTSELPTGSEGRLQCARHFNDQPNVFGGGGKPRTTRFTFVVWGDLRDYTAEDEIVSYLTKIVAPDGLMVRGGVAEIDVESSHTSVYRCVDSAWQRVAVIEAER